MEEVPSLLKQKTGSTCNLRYVPNVGPWLPSQVCAHGCRHPHLQLPVQGLHEQSMHIKDLKPAQLEQKRAHKPKGITATASGTLAQALLMSQTRDDTLHKQRRIPRSLGATKQPAVAMVATASGQSTPLLEVISNSPPHWTAPYEAFARLSRG